MKYTDKMQHYLVSRVKIRHLKLLVTIAEQRNIYQASQLMNIAQPAATKSIRDLENALDLQLFNRGVRGVTTTPYGDVLVKHAKLILSQIKHASEELASLKEGISGHISVGALLATSPALLPKSLALLKNQRNNIAISIVEGTNDRLMPALAQGDLDLVVGRLPEVQDYEDLQAEILYYEPVAVVARQGHPLSKKKKLALKDLMDENWILPPIGTTLRRVLDNEFHKQSLKIPQNSIASVSILTNRTLLMVTDMIAVMPYQLIHSYEELGLLCQLPVEIKAELGPVGVTTRANIELTPATNFLLDAMRTVASNLKEQQPSLY